MVETKDAIYVAIAANVPLIITGSPGMGKTAFVNQLLGPEENWHLEAIIASLRDPTDFGGLPIKTGDEDVVLAAPRWAKRLTQAVEEGTRAALFIDEITTAAPATQAALLRVIHERVVGDLKLPYEVRMIAAANPSDEAAGGYDLEAPLANRFFHYAWDITAKNWAEGFMQGFPKPNALTIPENVDAQLLKYRALVSSYVHKAGKGHLLSVPEDEAKRGGPWASPRTWEMAAILMSFNEAMYGNTQLNPTLLSGSVGEGEAVAFTNWLKEQNLPNPRTLLKSPEDFKLPERGDVAYTVLNSVVAEAMSTGPTEDDWVAAWKLLKAAGDQGGHDTGAAAARTLTAAHDKNPSLPVPLQYIKPYMDMLVKSGLMQKAS